VQELLQDAGCLVAQYHLPASDLNSEVRGFEQREYYILELLQLIENKAVFLRLEFLPHPAQRAYTALGPGSLEWRDVGKKGNRIFSAWG